MRDVTCSLVDMKPIFDEAYCIYLQGTMVSPWTGTGPHKRGNGREIAQIMMAEKQIRGKMMWKDPEEKYRVIHGSCKRGDDSHDITPKKTFFLYSQPLLTLQGRSADSFI